MSHLPEGKVAVSSSPKLQLVIEGEKADGSTLQQIKDSKYTPINIIMKNILFLLDIEFSQVKRNIVRFEWKLFDK